MYGPSSPQLQIYVEIYILFEKDIIIIIIIGSMFFN